MTTKTSLIWIFTTASFSLLAAIAVYCFARLNPPEFLESFRATSALLSARTGLFGSLPSLCYTLSIGLLLGVCASTPTDARLHCLSWICLAICLELAQHSIVAGPLASWLAETLPVSTWQLVGPYWIFGVFDPMDIFAAIAGGGIALTLLTYFPTEHNNENGR